MILLNEFGVLKLNGDIMVNYPFAKDKAENFWYGRINKHPEDCSREEIFRLMEKFAERYKHSILPRLEAGDKIKLYGKETTVEGFRVSYNDSLQEYEIILLTTHRTDPFYRSLDCIEVL